MNSRKLPGAGLAAAVCIHVSWEGEPILQVARLEPVDPQDSGWMFKCGDREDHPTEE